jgi:hypothetical protein
VTWKSKWIVMILGVNLRYHSKKFYPLKKISILSVRMKLFVSPLIHSLKTYDSFLCMDKQRRICLHQCCMKRFWTSNLVTLAYQKSITSSCIDNFSFCLFINKNGRIIRFQWIRVITKLPNSEQSYKGKVKTHNYINRQNQSTTGKLWKP